MKKEIYEASLRGLNRLWLHKSLAKEQKSPNRSGLGLSHYGNITSIDLWFVLLQPVEPYSHSSEPCMLR